MINMLEIGIIELLLQYVPWALYTRKAAVGYSTSSLEMQMKLPGTRNSSLLGRGGCAAVFPTSSS